MFSVDETGPGFFPRLFFLTMSYTMKICFLLLLSFNSVSGITPLKVSAFLVKFQNLSGSSIGVALGKFSMRRKNLSSADVLKDLFMLHRLAKTIMGIVLSSSSQKFKLLNSVFMKERSSFSCLSWTV